MIQKMWTYLKVGIEDEYGQFSGKRALGTICIYTGLILTSIVSFKCEDKLAEQTMLIAPVFVTGLTFWGLTSYQSLQTDKMNKDSSAQQQIIDKV